MNYEGDLDSMLGFFWADSAFYPQFDALLRLRVVENFGSGESQEDAHPTDTAARAECRVMFPGFSEEELDILENES